MENFIENRVVELFGNGQLFCAETVLAVIAESGGKDPESLIGMATGFCSGASRTSGQCGAVSGAIMGIGLFAGRTELGGDVDPAYTLVQEFLARFNAKFSSINCFELVGCDFATEEGSKRFKEEGLLKNCINFAVVAAEIALDLLREHGYLQEYEEMVKSQVAPCGLSCGKCVAYVDGPVQAASLQLADALGDNFGEYAKRFEGMNPVFEGYESFRDLLDFFAKGSCTSCRDKGCLFKSCKVTECVKEMGVDYCYECTQFPCEKHGMPDGLAERWQANNEAMQKHGLSAWFTGCRTRPRYP